MRIDFNAITDAGIDESKLHLSSNTWSDKRFDLIKDTKVFYQWGTDKISMSIPVEIFINDKTQIINNLNPPYHHVVCLNAVKSFGAGLFFIWNNTKFVLSLFIDNLLATHQWYNLLKSSFAWIITSFKFSPYDNKEVSSTNNLTALHPTALYISLMYNKKNNGPRTDPWGTPHFTKPISDCTPLATVNWRLLFRYDLKNIIACPLIP